MSAKIILDTEFITDSYNLNERVITLELEFPKFILAEFSKHRNISFNTSSSRAIPVEKMLETIQEHPIQFKWTKKGPGMSGESLEEDSLAYQKANEISEEIQNFLIEKVRELDALGIHKQHANRFLETFQTVKVIATANYFRWMDFLWLRLDTAVQPEMYDLAKEIQEAIDNSTPERRGRGEWYIPYVDGVEEYKDLPLLDKLKISASCCAQVSYRKLDTSIEKSIDIYNKLVGGQKLHATPFEHQFAWDPNNTSGNITCGYQFRHIIEKSRQLNLSLEEGIKHYEISNYN
jgi:hypothetical protein